MKKLLLAATFAVALSSSAFGAEPAKKTCITLFTIVHDASVNQALGQRIYDKAETDRIWAVAITLAVPPKKPANMPYSISVVWDAEVETVFFRDKCAIGVLHQQDDEFVAMMKAAGIQPKQQEDAPAGKGSSF